MLDGLPCAYPKHYYLLQVLGKPFAHDLCQKAKTRLGKSLKIALKATYNLVIISVMLPWHGWSDATNSYSKSQTCTNSFMHHYLTESLSHEKYVIILFPLQIRKLRVRRVSSLPMVNDLVKGKIWTWTLVWLMPLKCLFFTTMLYCSGSHSVVPAPAASKSPGNLLEMQSDIYWTRNSGCGAQQSLF